MCMTRNALSGDSSVHPCGICAIVSMLHAQGICVHGDRWMVQLIVHCEWRASLPKNLSSQPSSGPMFPPRRALRHYFAGMENKGAGQRLILEPTAKPQPAMSSVPCSLVSGLGTGWRAGLPFEEAEVGPQGADALSRAARKGDTELSKPITTSPKDTQAVLFTQTPEMETFKFNFLKINRIRVHKSLVFLSSIKMGNLKRITKTLSSLCSHHLALVLASFAQPIRRWLQTDTRTISTPKPCSVLIDSHKLERRCSRKMQCA